MPIRSIRLAAVVGLGGVVLVAGACQSETDPVSRDELEQVAADLEARFSPGLHTLMGEVGRRHATLWFAGEAENWALADYMLHELEELVDEIETLHPEYDGVPVADLLGEMTHPALQTLEGSVDQADPAAFEAAFGELTAACNGCHIAADRAAIRVRRPTSPPITNLDFDPGG